MTKKILGFRRPVFPRPEFVSRLISQNENWAKDNLTNISVHEEKKPLGLVEERSVPMILAKNSLERLSLAKWLPPALQSTNLDLIYSTNHHGRSLEMFYRCCSSSRHTITLMEVLGTDIVIGMYATHMWTNNPDGYGDGNCFLFRLKPNPECFRYKVASSSISSFIGAEGELKEDDDEKNKATRLQDVGQLMISSDTFISMGVGEDGASGLRLNEDLTRGSTSKSIGFDNDELVGPGIEVFDVGLVEVYRFIRMWTINPWMAISTRGKVFLNSLLEHPTIHPPTPDNTKPTKSRRNKRVTNCYDSSNYVCMSTLSLLETPQEYTIQQTTLSSHTSQFSFGHSPHDYHRDDQINLVSGPHSYCTIQ